MKSIIGREAEIRELQERYSSDRAQFVAVYTNCQTRSVSSICAMYQTIAAIPPVSGRRAILHKASSVGADLHLRKFASNISVR